MTMGADHPAGKPEPSPARRRRGFAGALAAFMEERNIFWGELIGGILIVGCSIALVITLWDRLASNPLFKFATFVGADAAVFGAGMYTLKRWKLEATSRGLLLIALLLAPLTQLAMTVEHPGGSRLELPSQIASVLVLGLLAYGIGRVLIPEGALASAAAIMGVSACQLPAVWLVTPEGSESRFLLVGLAAAACHGLCLGAYLLGAARRPFAGPQARALLLFEGVAAFALTVTLGVLVYQKEDLPAALGSAAVLIALAGLPVMASGLLIHRRLAEGRRVAGLRTTGTAVGLVGMVLMVLAVGLAWPRPVPVLVICVLNFIVLTVIAGRCRLPAAHVIALPCLAVAYLVIYYLVGGKLWVPAEQLAARSVELVNSAETGTALVLLFLVLGGAGEILARLGQPVHGKWYALGGVCIAILSLGLVTLHGVDAPMRSAVVSTVYGAGILASNLRWRRAECTYLGLALLVGATLWGLWHVYRGVVPEWSAVLAFEALVLTVLASLARRAATAVPRPEAVDTMKEDMADSLPPQEGAYHRPLAISGEILGLAALGLVAWGIWVGWRIEQAIPWPPAHVVTALCLAALWTVAAVRERRWLYGRLAAWLTLGAVVAAAGWFGSQRHVGDIRGLLALGTALTSFVMASAVMFAPRRQSEAASAWQEVLAPAWLETAVVATLPALALALASVPWPLHALTAGLLAATAFLFARYSWMMRSDWPAPPALLTWIGSTLGLAGLAHLLVWGGVGERFAHPWLMALLAHATLALAAGLLPRSPALAKDFVTPLSRSALVSSFLALPLLLSVTHGQLMAFALYTLWLAGLWFVVSWLNRWPVLFAAFQGVLGLAVVLGIAAWRGLPRDQVLDLPELQLYALGVAALSLLWVLARHALRESPTSRLLLDPGWPTPDRVMLIGLLPVQLLLAIQGIAPGIAAELGPRGIQTGEVSGVGAAAWVLLGILVVTLVVEARERVRVHTLLGLLVLGLTVPVLIAGAFADQRAVASALRWGLGTCFVLYSVPLWWRSQLAQRFPRVDQDVSVPARWLLIAGTVVPVLLLTVTPVFVFWSGHSSAGVASGSWFLRIPRVVVTVLPLVLVCFGLIGHALREQSPGYAFAVGVGMNLGVSLIVRYYHRQDALAEWWIYLVQANVIAFGVTALLWLGARRHLYGSAGSGPLLGLQVALAPLSVVVLLGYLAVSLVSEPATVSVSVAQGGGWPGWVALALAVGVVGWHLRQRAWRSAGQAVFALLVAVPVLAACVAARWSDRPWLAYHVLAAGWATAATLVLACGWRWTGERRIDAVEPTFPAPLVCTWIQALTALLVGLGLREMAADPASPWWPMATVLAAGGVAAATAVWQRSTGWAFSAGLALNLAVSLVLWHGHHEKPFEEWWVQLVQANVLAWAGGALLWLAVRRRLYGSDSRGMPTAPLLSLQVGLGLLGSAALLVGPAIWLISQPDLAGELARASMAQAGHVWSWLALVVALAAAGWHARQALAHAAIHVVGTVGVVVGVLAACTAARWHPGDWLGYHVLTAAWALVGIGLLAPAYRRPRRIEGAETVPPIEADAARVGWVTALAVLVAGLALRGAWEDPGGSWWSASALLAVSGLAVGLALWQRREGWMLAAGVTVNLAISLILWRTDPGAGSGRWWVLLAQANILTGTAVALVWQGFSRRLYGRAHPEIAITPLLNMQLAFVLLGGIALLAGPAELLLLQPGSADEGMRQTGTVWGWLSFVGATGAAAWHMRGRLVGVGVHILCGMGLGLAVLAACTANTWETDIPWVSYHTLTAACALLGVATLAGGWSIRRRDATETTLAFGTDAVAGWAATFTGLALGLALRGLEVDPLRPWWPAGVALVAGGVCGGLALRQRREWWAFAAGLTVNLAISLLLWAGFQTLDREERWVALVQANVLAGAGVAVLWLLASRRLYGDRGPGITAAPLLGVQVGLILLGNAALLVGPAVRLIAEPYPVAESVRQAGQVWSWLALLAALVVGVWYAGKTLAAGAGHIVRGLGLAVGILAACTVTTWQQGAPWLGYYMLLLAWVLTGWATLLMGWLRTGAAAPNESERGWGSLPSARVTRGWVAVISLLVVGLAVREANWPGFAGQPRLAGVVLTVAGLLAATAVWARREVWAFAAALTVNFAVSLFVWDLYSGTPLALWWSPLLRANLIAVAVVALVWLFLARRLVPGRPGPFTTPLLTLQTAAGSVGAVVLVALPAIWLIRQPESLHSEVYAGGQLAAWLSLLLPALAAAVYLHHSTDRVSLHLLAPVGLAVGVLTACMLGHWDRHDWLAYHTLLVAWVVAALAFLTLAWGRSRWYATSDVPSVKDLPATVVPFPEGTWLTVISLLVVGLSLRGVGMDPGRPWWSAGAILAVSVLAGIRALWQRQEGWALTAGLGVNLAVSLVFWELHHTAPLELWLPRLIQANVIVCSGVALMWVALRPRLDPEQRSGPLLGLQLLLAVGGNIVLLAVPLALLVARPWTVNPLVREAGEIWGWLALLPALAASAWHCRRVTLLSPVHVLAVATLGLGVMTACTVGLWDDGNWLGYHTLMGATVAAGAIVLLGGPQVAERISSGSYSVALPNDLVRRWVGFFCLVVVALALRGVGDDPLRPWWSACAIAAVGVLAGSVALWQRREGWALAATLALNLAVSLAIWGGNFGLPLETWWVRLVQANLIANACAALAWLAASRHFSAEGTSGWLLRVEAAVGLVGNTTLLVWPLVHLLLWPGASLPISIPLVGDVCGWLALLSAAGVAVAYLQRVPGWQSIHVLCGFVLAAGVMAACTAANFTEFGDWFPYHVLTFSWAMAGFVVLVTALRGETRHAPLPARAVGTWIIALALLAIGVALRGTGGDPLAPWTGVVVAVTVGILFAAMAWWRQHEGWAVAAGLAVNLAATLVVTHFQKNAGWDEWWTSLVQVNIISSVATTVVWLVVRRQRYLDRTEEIGASPILSIKIAADLAANALLFVGPLVLLVVQPAPVHPLVTDVGDVWSWIALLSSLALATWRFRDIAGRFGVYVLCGLGLTLGVLAASTAAGLGLDRENWLSYHVLTAFWALTGVAAVAAAWNRGRTSETTSSGVDQAIKGPVLLFPVHVVRRCVLLLAALVAGLALRGVAQDPTGPWWSAGAILSIGLMGGLMAGWQRWASWAFASGFAVNAAVSLVLWRLHQTEDFATWSMPLMQANVLATAFAALVWLAGRSRLYEKGQVLPSPLLSLQVRFGLIGNAALLIGPLVWLIAHPAPVHHYVKEAGDVWGWLALLAAITAALWHMGQRLARAGMHTLCGLGLALGVLAACTAAHWDQRDWFGYHVLLVSWVLVGAGTLAIGWVASRRTRLIDLPPEGRPPEPWVSVELVRGWVGVVCVLVLGLALRGAGQDPAGYFWTAGTVFAVSVLAGAMALWQRSDGWTFAAGLGVNLAVSLLFWDWHLTHGVEHYPFRLLQVNLITGAVVALVWLGSRRLSRTEPGHVVPGVLPSLQVMLSVAGNAVLLLGALGWLVANPTGGVDRAQAQGIVWVLEAGSALGWVTWALGGAALLVWVRQRGLVPKVHGTALVGLGLLGEAACTVEALAPGWGYRTLMLGWAGFAFGFAVLTWALATRAPNEKTRVFDRAAPAAAWVGVIALAVVFLALKAALEQQDYLWAAAAVAGTSLALLITALRQQRESWALAAGLAANLAVSLLFWNYQLTHGIDSWQLRLVQVNLITSAATVLMWLGTRRLGRADAEPTAPGVLLTAQLGVGAIGNGVLLLGALGYLVTAPASWTVGAGHPPGANWIIETGSALGWVSWILLGMAVTIWARLRHLPTTMHDIALPALVALAQLACTVEALAPGWGYRALMLGWAVVALALMPIARRLTATTSEKEETATAEFAPSAEKWIAVIAFVIVGLALKAAVWHADHVWAAAAVAILSIAAVVTALSQRRERWAFAAGLGVNLAVSLLVWRGFQEVAPARWWITLLQANVIASSVVALAWLATRGWLYPASRAGGFAPLLGLQVLLCVAGNAVLLIEPAVFLVQEPGSLHEHVLAAGQPWGWVALFLAVAVALWHAGKMLTRGRIHVLCSLGLALAVLAACTAGCVDHGGSWLSYHVLMAGCALTGAAVLGRSWRASLRRCLIDVPPSILAEQPTVSSAPTYGWVAAVCALLVGLALRGAGTDPAAPWWSAGAILAAATLAAGVALWQRLEGWAFVAAVGVNLAVSLVLWHSHRGELLGQWWVSLVQLNALATAAAALLWMTASRRFYGTTTPLNALPPLLTLQVTLGLAANLVLVTVGGVRLIAHPGDASPLILNVGHWVGWLALITALAAAARYLGPTLARIRLEALAVTGLASGVLAACAAGRWDHGHWLAYHVLLTACAVVGVATLAVGWLTSSDRPARNWVGGISVVVLSLALHGPGEDPTGHTWSAGAVLAVSVTAALLALWHRREWWAFGAGLALNLAVSLLLWDYHRGDSFSEWWVPLVQANVLAASAVALLWLAVRRRLVGSEQSAPLLTVQVALGLLGNAVLLIGPMSELLIHPGTIGGDVAQAGTVWGWLSLLGALAAAVWHVGQTVARGSVHVLCVLGLGLGVLAACTVGRWDTHNWLAYHTLTVAWALTAVAALAIGWLSDSRGREATPSSALPPGLLQGWATALAAMVVLLALRGVGQDPSGPVWTAGVVLVGSALAGALAVWSRLQFYVYVSGLLGCLAGTVLLNTWHQPLELVKVNALCLALASAFWVAVELTLQRTRGIDLRVGSLPFGHLAAGVAGCAVALLVGLGVSLDFTGAGVRTASPLTWAALLATALALAVCLRDPSARMPLADLYLLGLSALGLALHSLAPTPRWLAGPLLSGYVLLTAVLWSLAQRATGLGPVLRRAVLAETKVGFWLAPAQTLLACAAVGLSVWTCVYLPTVAQREMAALTTGLLLPAALLACCGREGRRPALQYVVLALGNLLAVEAGWACLDPGAPMPWLYRAGLLVAILTPMTIFYGVILARSLSAESGWARCARQTGTVLGILTVGALISVLAQEVLHFRLDLPPPADLPAALFIVAVAGAVAMMVVTAIALAVAPGLDPFGLSERGRTAYVYAAEVLLVLLFAHTRLSAPHLFHREMARYWPFAVLTIAFLGAATGELFRRLSLRVLAEPLERTGIFLPMLPVAVFWVQPTGSYATVWFLVGLLYVFLSVTRRSLGFALLAALAANVGLWLVLHQNQLAFIQHPQLWLIPLALSVLGAEHLNRDRLSKTQRNTIRYLALTAIYISSTAETFLTGLGQDAVRPAVLVGLSVLGVFVGMMLRVRAFLFLGSAFLLLGIFAVIRHAAHAAEDRGRIVWLVAGIVLGAAIFTLFAIFEKRRNEVLRLLQKLKDWE